MCILYKSYDSNGEKRNEKLLVIHTVLLLVTVNNIFLLVSCYDKKKQTNISNIDVNFF